MRVSRQPLNLFPASIVDAICRCSGQRHLLAREMKHHDTPSSTKPGRFIPFVLGLTAAALLAAIAIPNYVRARSTMSMNTCIFNQMWIESAKRQWATENHKPSEAVPTDAELLGYMRQITPMWAGRKHAVDLPAQLPTCFLRPTPYAVGSVTNPIHCNAIESDHWDETAYRFHYALGAR